MKTPDIDDSKIDTSYVHKGIFLSFTASRRNAKYYFVMNEAHFCSPEIIPLYAKDLLEYNK